MHIQELRENVRIIGEEIGYYFPLEIRGKIFKFADNRVLKWEREKYNITVHYMNDLFRRRERLFKRRPIYEVVHYFRRRMVPLFEKEKLLKRRLINHMITLRVPKYDP